MRNPPLNLVRLCKGHLGHVIGVGADLKFARLGKKKVWTLLKIFRHLRVQREGVISHRADEVYMSCLNYSYSLDISALVS